MHYVFKGGGINSRNLKRILTGSGAKEFHCSARRAVASAMIERNTNIHMGAAYYPPEYSIKIADASITKELVSVWKNTRELES